jgi:hypothetical protein
VPRPSPAIHAATAGRGVSFGFKPATSRTRHPGDGRIKSGHDDIIMVSMFNLALITMTLMRADLLSPAD